MAQTPEPGTTRAIELNSEIKLWLADQKRYGAALLFATGSRDHLQELQKIAKLNGLQLTDAGLVRGKRIVPTETEEHVYGALSLPFIPPELREGEGEVALARARRLPELIKQNDLHGLLHCHTDFSDGGNTLEEMAEAPASGVITISEWPTIRGVPDTPAASASTRSRSSTRSPTS